MRPRPALPYLLLLCAAAAAVTSTQGTTAKDKKTKGTTTKKLIKALVSTFISYLFSFKQNKVLDALKM